MPDTSLGVIKRYLEDAIAAERSVETQLRTFSKEGADDEVQAAFAGSADEAGARLAGLTARLNNLGGSPSTTKSFLAQLFGLTPKTEQIGHEQEERVPQNLIVAYTASHSACAMYEALQAAAEAAGDEDTQQLVQNFQEQHKGAAERFWAFLRSRAKIAFNLLTISEVDPVLNTRALDNRILE